jgi:hypothetical protein
MPKALTTHQIVIEPSDHVKLRFAPDETLLACLNPDPGYVQLFAIPEGRLVASVGEGIESNVRDLVFLRAQSRVAMASADGVRIWNYSTNQLISHLLCGPFIGPGIITLKSNESSQRLLAVRGQEVYSINPQESQPLARYVCRTGEKILQAAFLEGDPLILLTRDVDGLSAQHQGGSCLWSYNLTTRDKGVEIPYNLAWPAFVVSPSAKMCVVCTDLDRGLYDLWNLATSTHIAQVAGAPSRSLNFSFLEQGRLLIGWDWLARDGVKVAIWSTESGAVVRILDVRDLPDVVVSANQNKLISLVTNRIGDKVNRTIFMDPETNRVVGEASGHPGSPDASHAFSHRDRWFASASTTNSSHTQVQASDDILFLTDLTPLFDS